MTDHDGTTHFCGRCGGIGGTIVDEQDRISTPPHFGDDARDHAGLIVGGDYNPDTLARVGLHGSSSDKQESAKNKTKPITNRTEIGSAKTNAPSNGGTAKPSAPKTVTLRPAS